MCRGHAVLRWRRFLARFCSSRCRSWLGYSINTLCVWIGRMATVASRYSQPGIGDRASLSAQYVAGPVAVFKSGLGENRRCLRLIPYFFDVETVARPCVRELAARRLRHRSMMSWRVCRRCWSCGCCSWSVFGVSEQCDDAPSKWDFCRASVGERFQRRRRKFPLRRESGGSILSAIEKNAAVLFDKGFAAFQYKRMVKPILFFCALL